MSVRVWDIVKGISFYVFMGYEDKGKNYIFDKSIIEVDKVLVYSIVYDFYCKRCVLGFLDSIVKVWDIVLG